MTKALTADCLSDLSGIRHGFFTRHGGVSEGIYASLNCGHGSADRRDHVTENRRRVAEALGQRRAEQVLTLYQVHSAIPLVVDRPIPREELPKADALVTRTPGLVIGALAADCTPVLFADPHARVVAAAHAGWRGAFTGILEATIRAMEGIGAARGRISAAVGPCINQPAYEVGPEFEAQFLAADSSTSRFFNRPHPGARPHFDLPGYVEHRLVAAGLAAIERCSPCTFASESAFFSYRRTNRAKEPDYGRQISAIVVD
jgi:YfiH family protein